MTNSTMCKLLNQLGLSQRQARKRTARRATICHLSAERLEERALLSATSLAESNAAEVHHSRNTDAKSLAHEAKAATYPSVGGTWNLVVSGPAGDLPGDLLVSQDPPTSRKFTASFNIELGSLDLKGKFDSQDNTHAFGKAILAITGSPKVHMKFNVTYGNNFTTLTGSATAKKFPTVTFTGNRQEA